METARRSSRAARAGQPNSHDSSTSSNSSGRADRTTRRNHKTESPRKSTPTASLSSEPREDSIAMTIEDTLSTRRRKRGQAEEVQKAAKVQTIEVEMTNGNEEEIAEDDEAVRCICGFDEYPGPPPVEEDSKHGIKDVVEVDTLVLSAEPSEDVAGFFLQCDVCKVWQHGGCVGIMNEDQSPDEYFCEDCRKDLHKIFTAPNGQRYSHYLPLYQTLSRNTSRAASFSKDGTRSPRAGSKSGRPSSSLQSAKRRSTMNSRDAAYDEGEALRRAIEASRGENSGESNDGTSRRGKRGRSESEEKTEGTKRQKTASRTPSPVIDPTPPSASQPDSDDGINGRNIGAKKIRGAAARNHREKEMREEKERLRLEAANKRKGRAERRRIDDSDHSEEIPLAQARSTTTKTTEAAAQPLDPPVSQPILPPESPPPQPPPIVPHKKGGRPPNSRKGKLGKNQYTKDKDHHESNHQSPNRSQSRDVVREESTNTPLQRNGNEGKAPRARGTGGSKISMTDMKRKVAAILDYIQRTQLEMAGESRSPSIDSSRAEMIRGLADNLPMIKVNEEKAPNSRDGDGNTTPEKEFKNLSCMEMMDVLTKQLIKWQKEFT